MLAAAKGKLGEINVKVKDEYAMVVVLAAEGYPNRYRKGDPISFPDSMGDNQFIFHAGTRADDAGNIVTNGGRVLGVTALGANLPEARDKAYKLSDRVEYKSKYLRRDIGAKELARTE